MAANAVLLAGGSLAALLLLEVFLRLMNPLGTRVWGDRIRLPRNERYVWNNHWNPKLDSRIVFTKNSFGFRGPEPPIGERPLAIVAMGGSTTECLYLSDGKDWPAVTGQALLERFPRSWVNNAGMDGHSTYGHRLLVEQWILRLRPQVVVLLVGLNDLGREDLKAGDRDLRAADEGWSLDSLLMTAARRSAVAAISLNLRRTLRAHQRELLHRELQLETLPSRETPPEERARELARHGPFVAAYAVRLRDLVGLLRGAGIDVVLATQPALYGPGRDDLTGVDLAAIEVRLHSDRPIDGALAWQVLELYNAATRRVGAEQGAALVDLAAEVPKSSRLFYDFVHFTNLGAAEVGAVMARRLCPVLARRFPEHAARPCAESAQR